MNARNYRWYAALANKVVADGFRIEDHVGSRENGMPHLLCIMAGRNARGIEGAAFRHWVAGLFGHGVFVYADNYKVGIVFASVPDATVTRGCQDSCCNANPWPRLSHGGWVHVDGHDVPADVRTKVLAIASQLMREAASDILEAGDQYEREETEKADIRTRQHDAMVAAWA